MFIIETTQGLRFSQNPPQDDVVGALVRFHGEGSRIVRLPAVSDSATVRDLMGRPGTIVSLDGLTVTVHTREVVTPAEGENPAEYGDPVLAGTFAGEQMHPALDA